MNAGHLSPAGMGSLLKGDSMGKGVMNDDIDKLQEADQGTAWVTHIEGKLKQGNTIGFDELSVWLAYQVNKTIHPPVAMRIEAELLEAVTDNRLRAFRDKIDVNEQLARFLGNYYGVTLPNYLSEEDKSKLLDVKAALAEIESAPKTDWAYWKQLFTVGIEDAVYLTLDVNPNLRPKLLRLSYAKNIPDEFIQPKAIEAYELLKLHQDRVDICASHRKSIGGSLPSHGNTKQVYLDQFGAWAKGKGWSLPDDFPIAENQDDNPLVDYRDSDKYPEELDIAFQVWRAVAVNGQGEGVNSKAKITHWLKVYYPTLTKSALDRIATVANWDKAGGKPKGVEGFDPKGG